MTFPIVAANGPSGYNLTRSLRFRSSASAYLSRTFLSNGNQQKWTWSGWVKAGRFGSQQPLFNAYSSVTDYGLFTFSASGFIGASDTLKFYTTVSNATQSALETAAVFRDPASWYHIVLQVDTTQATASNRIRIYVNGVQQTLTGTQPSQNANIGFYNTTSVSQQIGALASGTYGYFDGYMTEINFIDGQALTPSSFGSTNTLTGVWQPAQYTGTYGTNGFELQFTDNSGATATTIGKDFSGNGNNWTPNNISVTAGVTYDSMTDVPTLTSATAANFAVLNPLENVNSTYMVFQNGNLRANMGTGAATMCWSTIVMPTNKWYWEVTITTVSNGTAVGISYGSNTISDGNTKGITYSFSGGKRVLTVDSSYGATYTTGDVIGIAVDKAASTVTFYKNNASQGAISDATIATQDYRAMIYNNTSGASGLYDINFGQRPFAYTPPTGFVALNTFNLPTSTIVKGNTVMDVNLWAGTGATLNVVNAAGFKPDLVWGKTRSNTYNHALFDSVRGVNKALASNSTAAEVTQTQGLLSFNSNGFTLGTSADSTINNAGSGQTYVGWQWQAGQGTTSSNTSGTITSTVSVNATAGFSIVTYTGNGIDGATVGHGLGVAPQLIITKKRDAVGTDFGWSTYHVSNGTANIWLNETNAKNPGNWATAPTSSVFTPAILLYNNVSSSTYVNYCWTPIAGYSAFGSYTGNGSTDGPFVYLGFKPRWLMVKVVSTAGYNWVIVDTARNEYNPQDKNLYPNLSAAEDDYTSTYPFDILSNGFKPRANYGNMNLSGATIIYAAFAEVPFKNSLAR